MQVYVCRGMFWQARVLPACSDFSLGLAAFRSVLAYAMHRDQSAEFPFLASEHLHPRPEDNLMNPLRTAVHANFGNPKMIRQCAFKVVNVTVVLPPLAGVVLNPGVPTGGKRSVMTF
jgi:hypothetical protein